MNNEITDKQIIFLRKRCHHIKPVVSIGAAGLTENVMGEIELALSCHELIKLKISGDATERKIMVGDIVTKTTAVLVQTIGHTASFYRPADKPVISLPKI
ncbi:MAG: YhbY family RNA-binding protein [Woeseiaceae bacterium]